MKEKSTRPGRRHKHSELETLIHVIKEQGELMIAQVDALTSTASTLKTTVDQAIAFIGSTPTISAADLAALEAANTSLQATNTALNTALSTAQAK